jgi:hypothetical protein
MGTVDCSQQSVATGVTYTDGATPGARTSQVERAARLRYVLASAGGSWGREFRLLLTLAESRGVSLDADADALTFYDVRDLQALQRRIMTVRASRSTSLMSR